MAFREIQLTNVATSVAELDDPLLRMNAAETGTNASDVGLVFERGSLTNVALMWDDLQMSLLLFLLVKQEQLTETLQYHLIQTYRLQH